MSAPYRWLEDLKAPETRAFMTSQEALLASFLDRERVDLLERRIDAFGETGARLSVPTFAGGRYFYTVQSPDARHATIFSRQGREGEGKVVLDPNVLLAEDQSFGDFSVSPRGRYVVYRTFETGSRWGELQVLKVASGETLGKPLDDRRREPSPRRCAKRRCCATGALDGSGAGHGFGTTREQSRRTYAEELSFLAQVLDLRAE